MARKISDANKATILEVLAETIKPSTGRPVFAEAERRLKELWGRDAPSRETLRQFWHELERTNDPAYQEAKRRAFERLLGDVADALAATLKHYTRNVHRLNAQNTIRALDVLLGRLGQLSGEGLGRGRQGQGQGQEGVRLSLVQELTLNLDKLPDEERQALLHHLRERAGLSRATPSDAEAEAVPTEAEEVEDHDGP